MNYFRLLPTLCCLLTVLFPSCIHKADHSKEIAQLDSAATALNTAQQLVLENTALDSTGVNFLTGSIDDIRSKLGSDTVDKHTGTVLTEINNLKSMLTELAQYRDKYTAASRQSLERVKNLQHDLTEGLLEENKAREYIVNERKTLDKIVAELSLIREVYNVSAVKLDSLKPRISSLIDSLNTQ